MSVRPYMRLDINCILDPDIQLMIMDVGEAALAEYFILCAQMYNYDKYDFAIPEKCIKSIAGLLQTTELELRKTISYCIGNGFFKTEEKDGETYIYSERRRCELHKMQAEKNAKSEAGKRGMANRWKNSKEGESDHDN